MQGFTSLLRLAPAVGVAGELAWVEAHGWEPGVVGYAEDGLTPVYKDE